MRPAIPAGPPRTVGALRPGRSADWEQLWGISAPIPSPGAIRRYSPVDRARYRHERGVPLNGPGAQWGLSVFDGLAASERLTDFLT